MKVPLRARTNSPLCSKSSRAPTHGSVTPSLHGPGGRWLVNQCQSRRHASAERLLMILPKSARSHSTSICIPTVPVTIVSLSGASAINREVIVVGRHKVNFVRPGSCLAGTDNADHVRVTVYEVSSLKRQLTAPCTAGRCVCSRVACYNHSGQRVARVCKVYP